jgi:60 kDa SS-A/Ro ribonucleoprotein
MRRLFAFGHKDPTRRIEMKNANSMSKNFTTPKIVQSQDSPIVGRESEMVQSDGGGYAFSLDALSHVRRFLILGADDGHYRTGTEFLVSAADSIVNAIKDGRGVEVVALIEDVNTVRVEGGDVFTDEDGEFLSDKKYIPAAAPRKAASLFALALCHHLGNDVVKAAVHGVIRRRAVISTLRQMYEFLNAYKNITAELTGLEGTLPAGSGMKKAITHWMSGNDRRLAYQAIKYRASSFSTGKNKSHRINLRDLLRTYHVKPSTADQNLVFLWATKMENLAEENLIRNVSEKFQPSDTLSLLSAFEVAQTTTDVKTLIRFINEYGLPHEAIPNTWFSSDKAMERCAIWTSLLGVETGKPMSLTALIRNMTRMASYGVFKDRKALDFVIDTLNGNGALDRLIKARVHPIRLLSALRVYESGISPRSSHEWNPQGSISQALEGAFYKSFGAVPSTGKKLMYGIDVSGSMGSQFGLIKGVTSREVAAVMAMVTAQNEREYEFYGFGGRLEKIDIRPGMRLRDVTNMMTNYNFGSTDPSLLARYATQNSIDVDAFIIVTDNDLNTGEHPTSALDAYRRSMKKNDTRMVVIGTEPSEYTIADPKDPLQLDVVGFDAAAPAIISDFCAGRI